MNLDTIYRKDLRYMDIKNVILELAHRQGFHTEFRKCVVWDFFPDLPEELGAIEELGYDENTRVNTLFLYKEGREGVFSYFAFMPDNRIMVYESQFNEDGFAALFDESSWQYKPFGRFIDELPHDACISVYTPEEAMVKIENWENRQ